MKNITESQIEDLNSIGYIYAQTPERPAWHSSENGLIASATSGSSPFNEWYLFRDRAAALKVVSTTFNSQTFIDRFMEVDGEYYDLENVEPDGEEWKVRTGAQAADIQDMVQAESRF